MPFWSKLRPLLRYRTLQNLVPRSFSQKVPNGLPFSKVTNYAALTAVSFGVGYGLYSLVRRVTALPQNNLTNVNYGLPGDSLRSQFNFINKVVEKCAPSVVYVEIKDPLKMDPETGLPMTASNGSGFLVQDDGWILTNAHVVINKPNTIINVMLHDGSSYQATVEDADMNVDIALLKINPNRKLPCLQLGKSADVTPGEWVVALGSPLSLSHSVTAGIISSVNRAAEELGLRNFSMRYIQTDAAITFGNSGGPLVNLDGDVIGINNLRVTAGISFAIPIDFAKKFLKQSTMHKRTSLLASTGSMLGVTTISITPEIIDDLIPFHDSLANVKHGVLIYKVGPGTIAYKCGLLVGDIITHINGVAVHKAADIYSFVLSKENNLKMRIIRNGKQKDVLIAPD